MAKGISIQLHDDTGNPLTNLSGIVALWWDSDDATNLGDIKGRTISAGTDSTGYLKLDISAVSGLSIGQSGFVVLHLPDNDDAQDSRTFQSAAEVTDVIDGTPLIPSDTYWQRPADRLPLPELPETANEFVGVVAVWPGNTFAGVVASGAYTVDWGDGVVENFPATSTASHTYVYETFDPSGDTLCSDGCKQALMRVYPQAGQSLTSLNLKAAPNNRPTSFLSYSVSSTTLTTLITTNTWGGVFPYLEEASVYAPSMTTVGDVLFYNIPSLKRVRRVVCGNGASGNGMFQLCRALERVDELVLPGGTSTGNMFASCSSLKEVPYFDTSMVTNASGMFNGCTALQTVPPFSTASLTNASNMFRDCSSLKTLPEFPYMFMYCTNFTAMFSGCWALTDTNLIYGFSGTSSSSYSTMFTSCNSLRRSQFTAPRYSHSYANCHLSADALNEIYTNLAAGVAGQTITVSGNYGTATDKPSIATAKGWTVTG